MKSNVIKNSGPRTRTRDSFEPEPIKTPLTIWNQEQETVFDIYQTVSCVVYREMPWD